MKRYLDYLWPLIGLVAVIWSVDLLWEKLKAEALTNEAVSARLEQAGLWESIKIVGSGIGEKIALIHSEISEALEAGRKNKNDDHLPQFSGVTGGTGVIAASAEIGVIAIRPRLSEMLESIWAKAAIMV